MIFKISQVLWLSPFPDTLSTQESRSHHNLCIALYCPSSIPRLIPLSAPSKGGSAVASGHCLLLDHPTEMPPWCQRNQAPQGLLVQNSTHPTFSSTPDGGLLVTIILIHTFGQPTTLLLISAPKGSRGGHLETVLVTVTQKLWICASSPRCASSSSNVRPCLRSLTFLFLCKKKV